MLAGDSGRLRERLRADMAAKKPKAKSPGKPGPSHKGMAPGLLERARPGDRHSLADVYGEASAWLRAGRAPPDELCRWVGERLLALAQALHAPPDAYKSELGALHIIEPGKRGAKPKAYEERERAALVLDVLRQKSLHQCPVEEAFEHVTRFHAAAGHFLAINTVRAAWRDRRKLIPEIDS